MAFVSVWDHDELIAVVRTMRELERSVVNQINRTTRALLAPIWTSEIDKRLAKPMDRKIIGAGVRVKAGNPPVVLAAQSTRAIDGRLRPADQWQGWEFGAAGDDIKKVTRRTKHGRHVTYERHTERQMPKRIRRGRIAYPALATLAPRMAAAWVQTVVRCVHEAAEAKRS